MNAIINGKTITFSEGETILAAARKNAVHPSSEKPLGRIIFITEFAAIIEPSSAPRLFITSFAEAIFLSARA